MKFFPSKFPTFFALSVVVCWLFPIWQYVQTAVLLFLLNIQTFFPFLPDAWSSSHPALLRNPSCSKQAPRTRPPILPLISYFPVRSQRTRPSSLPRPTLHNSVLPTRSLHVSSSQFFLGIISYFSYCFSPLLFGRPPDHTHTWSRPVPSNRTLDMFVAAGWALGPHATLTLR